MGNTLYVTRDNYGGYEDTINIWVDKPERVKDKTGIWFESDTCEKISLSLDDFKKIFDYTPRKGCCSRVNPVMNSI